MQNIGRSVFTCSSSCCCSAS